MISWFVIVNLVLTTINSLIEGSEDHSMRLLCLLVQLMRRYLCCCHEKWCQEPRGMLLPSQVYQWSVWSVTLLWWDHGHGQCCQPDVMSPGPGMVTWSPAVPMSLVYTPTIIISCTLQKSAKYSGQFSKWIIIKSSSFLLLLFRLFNIKMH